MRLIRNIGLYLGHMLTALIGTAILSTPIEKMSRSTSVAGILWKELILSIVCAGLIGFLVYRTWRSRIGIWVWILPAGWLALHILSSLTHPHSALTQSGGLWAQIFGFDCIERLAETRCRDFFLFTVPFIRSISYSLGTLVGIRLVRPVTARVREVKVP